MPNYLAVVFLFILPTAYAQQFTMPMRIQTSHGTVTHQVPVGQRFPTYYYGGSGTRSAVSHKHDFVVILKNDSVVLLRDAIRVSDSVHFLEHKAGRVRSKIYPNDTKQILRYIHPGKYTGIPADSCWLFMIKTGPINLYSYLAEDDLLGVCAFQLGDGQVQQLNGTNLLATIPDQDEKFLKFVKADKLRKAIDHYNDTHLKK
jgi:hypothetical protein